MKKTLKIAGIVLIVIIALLIAFPFLFKGKIIKTINSEANKTLNATLHFDDAHLSLLRDFPNFNLRIYNLSIAGKDTFANDTLVKFESFEAELNISSVISGDQIEINKLILDKANVHARILEDGTANWDIMLPDTVQEEEETSDADTTESSPMVFQLKKLVLKDSRIIYDDKEMGVFADTKGLNFELSGDLTEDISNLDIRTSIKELTVESDGVAYLYKINTEFEGMINADLKNSVYTFKKNALSMNKVLLEFDGEVAMPDSNIVIDINFKTPDTNFKNALSLIPQIYQKDFEGVQANGIFNLTGFVKGTYNSVNMPGYGMDLLVESANFSYPDLPKSVENINVAMSVEALEGSGDDITVDIKKAHLESAGNPFDASVYAAMTAKDTHARGAISGTIDFNSVKELIPLEDTKIAGILKTDLSFDGMLSDIENENYENFKAEGYFNLTGFELEGPDYPQMRISEADMNLSPQYMAVNTFKAQSSNSDFELSGRVDNILNYVFSDDLLSGNFTFKSSLIDADELAGLDEDSDSDTSAETAETTNEASSTEEVIRIPENIDFTLNSEITKVLYDGMEINDLQGKITVKNGVLGMENIRMQTLGGRIGMTGAYDSKPVKPFADFKMNLTGIDIQALFKQFVTVQRIAPIAEYSTGNISADIEFNSSLDDEMMPDYPTLNSSGNIRSSEIGIQNNSLFTTLGNKTKIEAFKNPTLKDVNLSYEIKDGNLELKPTDFAVKDSKMQISGTHNLDKNIDFDLSIEIPAKYADKLFTKLPAQKLPNTIDTEVSIGGTSDNPKITGVKNNVTEGLKETAEEKIDEVKEDLKANAQKIIDDAQKQADQLIKTAKEQGDKLRAEAKKAGEKLISEAEKQGKKLIDQAKNPIQKLAAEKSAEKLLKTAEEQAEKLDRQADKNAKALEEKAQKEADKIMETARNKAENL
jgi:hypothetical protein